MRCCEGVKPVTPVAVANRPGLAALSYRVGTHSSFLETMLARLSTSRLTPTAGTLDARGLPTTTYSALGGLNTRDPSDFSIALLDAWATVADVLTFYQERIANEGYLRTATERRSVVELARLIGYTPRPGVRRAPTSRTRSRRTAWRRSLPGAVAERPRPGPAPAVVRDVRPARSAGGLE